MNTNKLVWITVAAISLGAASSGYSQVPAAAPTPTIWRFMGIPQGIQKIRDVSLNRRGNFPRLERKPPLKRIADPANLESPNPAIKAAAEVKQAEDLKAQKIKAIKYLAKMGCGCYDKEGKITDALLAAMDDCTPDVRVAAIEAIEDTANGECCTKCGSTSCCSEKVTKRLSEIAYERDDTGCMLEPNADVRAAAARALNACCPNRATGPIEEDVPDELPEPEPVPQPIPGETNSAPDTIEGEGGSNSSQDDEDEEGSTSASDADTTADAGLGIPATGEPDSLTLLQSAQSSVERQIERDRHETVVEEGVQVEVGEVKMIGGMAIKPVTIIPVAATDNKVSAPVELSLNDDKRSSDTEPKAEPETVSAPLPMPIALPIERAIELQEEADRLSDSAQVFRQPVSTPKKVSAKVVGINHRTGQVVLRSGQAMRPGSSVTIYHEYLTGERLVAHLLIRSVNGSQAIAVATEKAGFSEIQTGDRAVCF